jgi:hypothetical protein
MAELERLKADERTLNAVVNVQLRTKAKLEKAFKSVRAVQKESSNEMETN